MKQESDIQAGGGDSIGRPQCYLCKRQSPGDLCEFWAGFCVYYDRTDFVDEVLIDAKYRDLHRYSVTVCDVCAAGLRRKHHLWGAVAWGLGFLACAVGAAVVALTQVAGGGTIYLVGVLGLFAALAGPLALMEAWQMRPGKWSLAVTRAVLAKVEKDPEFQKKGDSFFPPKEYRTMFPKAPDEPLTAEEILARDRTGEL